MYHNNSFSSRVSHFVWDELRGKPLRKALDRFRVQAQQLKIEPQIPVMARLKLKVPPA
jgi:hypothetical protein